MSAKSTTRILTFVAVGLVLSLPAIAMDQDNGVSSGSSPDAMAEIPAMTVPAVTLDFDLMPQGATTVAAIQAAFPGSGITNITFTTCTGSSPGVYNTNPSGRALAADPSGSLAPFLVDPPTGDFGCFDDITITFAGPITEFGSQVADWNGPITYTVFSGAANVGNIDLDHNGAALRYAESTVPFDSLVISSFPANPAGNYVFPTLIFPTQSQGETDLDISKTGQTTSTTTGRYTIRVENLGPDDATGVMVSDNLPAGVTYVSDTCGGVPGNPWTWAVGALANGASATCTIDVDITDPGDTTNVADVTGGQNDPNPSNDTATAQLPPYGGPIPTLGTAGILLLIGLMAGCGLVALRRFF